ncbi:MAG TPA: response regulator [Bradyrhizobium sp.]|nr:response regulator [Bradyrhizobium sp.]
MILLVDDNHLISEWINDVITSMGFDLMLAEGGAEAIDIVRSHPRCRLVFMDLNLPGGMTGIKAAAEIRKLPPPAGTVPIIGITGAQTYEDGDLRAAARFVVELQKPFLPRDIEALIQQYARSVER